MVVEILTDYVADCVEELRVVNGIQDLTDDVYDQLTVQVKDYDGLVMKNEEMSGYEGEEMKIDILILGHVHSMDETFVHYKQLYKMK